MEFSAVCTLLCKEALGSITHLSGVFWIDDSESFSGQYNSKGLVGTIHCIDTGRANTFHHGQMQGVTSPVRTRRAKAE